MEKEYLDYPGLGELADLVEKKFRLETMPTPSADWYGKIVQYIGATGAVYKNGYFYKCGHTGYDYEWVIWSVEPNVGQTTQYSTMPAANQTSLGKIVQYTGTTNINYTNGLFYECVALDTDPVTYGWQQKDTTNISGKEDVFRHQTMPTASAEYVDKIVEYTGTTNATYTNGYFYKCVEHEEESGGETVTTYAWEQQLVQDGGDSRISSEIVTIGVRIDDGYRPYISFDPSDVMDSFDNMSLDEILTIVDLYYNGDIPLTTIQDNWTPGESISINVNATDKNASQTVDLILMDINHDTLQTAEGEITKALLTLGIMLSENVSYSMPYSSSSLNTWFNGDGLLMLPSNLQSALRTVTKSVDGGFPERYQGGTTATVNTKMFLPTCPECLGRNITGAEIGGGTQYFSTGGGSRYAAHSTITRSKSILTASGWAKATSAPNWYTGVVGVAANNTAFCAGESGFMPHFCI